MYLKTKYLSLLCSLLLFVPYWTKAQDTPPTDEISSISLAVVMPNSIDQLTESSLAQLGNKLTAIVTNNGFAADSADHTYTIYPKFDITGIQETSATMQKIVIANCTFNLFIRQTSTKMIISQCIKQIQGTGYTKKEAIANAVNQISPDDPKYQKFIEAAKAKIIAYYQQNCQVFITSAERQVAQGHYDAANKILLAIPQETGQCYEDAQQKIAGIFEKQYGSLDKAVDHFQKEVTVDPASSIFSRLLHRSKKLVDKRNDANKTPPEIDLLTPKGTTSRGQGVDADVTPANGIYVSGTARSVSGIGSVTVNGAPVPDVTPDGFFQTNISKDATDINIVATDKKGNSKSVTFHIATKVEAPVGGMDIAPISDNEKFHAIFIANTNYSGEKWPALTTTIEEAKQIIKVLEDKYNFDPANVDTLFNRSRTEILSTVKDRLQKLSPNDNLILFYGGHGYFVESTNMAYWVPINCDNEFSYISNADITNLINGCQARHILIMADACFSGAMRGGLDAPSKYEYKFSSRQLLTSGGTEPVPGKSAYVSMILSVLNNNTDKYVSARELYTRIFKGIMDQTKTEPTLRDLQVSGSEGGQFYFRKN